MSWPLRTTRRVSEASSPPVRETPLMYDPDENAFSTRALVTSSSPPDGARGPLEGIVVVGVEQSVAGPLCTRILGDLGAAVIKVEPTAGDFSRGWDTHAAGESAQFWWLNRRKRSVAIDLREPTGQKLLELLLGHADVVVHNMSPGAAERLGLTGEAARERYPELVN